MDYDNSVTVLTKMRDKLKNERPTWYATASEAERTAFETKNLEKINALDCALKCIKAHKQLQRAVDYIQTNIIADEEN